MDSFVHRIVLVLIVMSHAMSAMALPYPIVPYAIRRHHRSTKTLINIPQSTIRGGGYYLPIDEYGRVHNPTPHLQQYNGLKYDGMQQSQYTPIPNHRYSKIYPSYGIPVYKGEYSYLPARHFNPTATALDDLQEEMSHEIERGDLDGYERREFPVGRETYFEKPTNDNENDYEDTDELTNRFLTNLIEYNRRLENDRNYNRDLVRYQKQFENIPDNLDGSLNEFLINRPTTIDEYVDDSVQYPENYYDIQNNVQPHQQHQENHFTGYAFQNEQPDDQQYENYYPNNNYYLPQQNSEMNLNNDHQNNNNNNHHLVKVPSIEIEKHNSNYNNNNNNNDNGEDEDVRNLRLLALNNNKYHSAQQNVEMKNLNNNLYTNQYDDDRNVYKNNNNNNKLIEHEQQQQQQQQQYYPSNQQLAHDDNNNLYDDSNSNNNEEDSENMWSHWDKKRSSNSAINNNNNNNNNQKIIVDKVAKNTEEIKNTFTDRKPATPLEIKNESYRQMKLLDGQQQQQKPVVPTTTNRPIVKQSAGVEENNKKKKPLIIKGQKEIVLLRPANPLRNPFTPPVMEMLQQQQHFDDSKQDDELYEKRNNSGGGGGGGGDGPAEENVISVFDTIRKMMEMEKELKQKSEDSPKQKRFVSDEQMLIKELDNLKRTA